jgi:hypothetical protein
MVAAREHARASRVEIAEAGRIASGYAIERSFKMKRTILSLTTAMALALPAAAQTGVDEVAADALANAGYPEASIDMLTQGEIAQLYLAVTSDDQSEVDDVIASFDLPSDGAADLPRAADPTAVETTVMMALEENGYSPDMVNALSSGDITNIYTAVTSEDQEAINDSIGSALEANAAMVSDDPSAASERAIDYLERRGYSQAEIDAVEAPELLAIYSALTSGDQNNINDAVNSAIES